MADQLDLLVASDGVQRTEELGRELGGLLKPADVLVLNGALGAGKTAFTRGLADGLNVRGPITSPTFVVARIHPSLGTGPALVHVDAYRLTSLDDLESIDLDAHREQSVIVIEWGEQWVDELTDIYLQVDIQRPTGDEEGDDRTIWLQAHGGRWDERLAKLTW